MREKDVVIVVPGAQYIHARNSFTKNLILLFYRTTRILKPVYTNYAKEWVHIFKKKGRTVIWLRWDRGFTIWSRWIATRMLRRKIVEYVGRGFRVQLVGISLGGDIALRAVRELGSGFVNRIVLVCSTNTNDTVPDTETDVINIYSEYDLFVTLMTKLIAPISGGMILKGKRVQNVAIESFSHDQFCANEMIVKGRYSGKRITDLIQVFLDTD